MKIEKSCLIVLISLVFLSAGNLAYANGKRANPSNQVSQSNEPQQPSLGCELVEEILLQDIPLESLSLVRTREEFVRAAERCIYEGVLHISLEELARIMAGR